MGKLGWERNKGLIVGLFLISAGTLMMFYTETKGIGGFLIGLGGFKLISETRE